MIDNVLANMGKWTSLPSLIIDILTNHLLLLHEDVQRKVTDSHVIGVAKSITSRYAPEIISKCNFSKHWARYFRQKIGLVTPRGPNKKKNANKASKTCSSNDSQVKFKATLRGIVRKKSFLSDLIFNIDYVKLSLTSGMKQSSNENHITLVLGVSFKGQLLPLQVVFAGIDETCFPKFEFPKDWNVTYSKSSRPDSETMCTYIETILIPFMKNIKLNIKDKRGENSLLIIDQDGAYQKKKFANLLKDANIERIDIPSHFTGSLQPLDQFITGYFKTEFDEKYTEYYEKLTTDAMNKNATNVHENLPALQISQVKELAMIWITQIYSVLAKDTIKSKSSWDHLDIKCNKK